MNRVHKQCPKIDSGIVPSQNGSKQAKRTECTARWPAARLGRPAGRAPRAQQCPTRLAANPCRAPRASAALRAPLHAHAMPPATCVAHAPALAARPCRPAPQRPRAPSACQPCAPHAPAPAPACLPHPCAWRPAPVPRTLLRPFRAARPAPSPASAQMGSSPFHVSAPVFFFSLFPATRKFKNFIYTFFFHFP